MCDALLGTRLVHHDLSRVIAAAGRGHKQPAQLRGEECRARARRRRHILGETVVVGIHLLIDEYRPFAEAGVDTSAPDIVEDVVRVSARFDV